jgi:hypothetical protein
MADHFSSDTSNFDKGFPQYLMNIQGKGAVSPVLLSAKPRRRGGDEVQLHTCMVYKTESHSFLLVKSIEHITVHQRPTGLRPMKLHQAIKETININLSSDTCSSEYFLMRGRVATQFPLPAGFI